MSQIQDIDGAISALQGYHEDAIDGLEDTITELRGTIEEYEDSAFAMEMKIDQLQEDLDDARKVIEEMLI